MCETSSLSPKFVAERPEITRDKANYKYLERFWWTCFFWSEGMLSDKNSALSNFYDKIASKYLY